MIALNGDASASSIASLSPSKVVSSEASVSSEGSILTGKQEHCEMVPPCLAVSADQNADLKRELLSRQVHTEIQELNTPTALQRFGAPFRSEYGEVSPVDSELPILRYVFVNHVRKFPFLDQAKEKEFWQDKLQVVGAQGDISDFILLLC